MTQRAIEQEGFNAYHAFKGAFRCPYKFGTDEFNAFERGWVQALKRDPSPVTSRELHPAPMQPQRSHFHLDLDPIKAAAEAYARKSGR